MTIRVIKPISWTPIIGGPRSKAVSPLDTLPSFLYEGSWYLKDTRRLGATLVFEWVNK